MKHAHIHIQLCPQGCVKKKKPFDLFSELVIQFCFKNAVAIYDDVTQYISVNNTEHLLHASWLTHQTIAPAVS